ncbi:MAG: hypothetical protein IJ766_03060 [Clostridia bacterium]|nr:hypothetical protein [Clostridia bacterium]
MNLDLTKIMSYLTYIVNLIGPYLKKIFGFFNIDFSTFGEMVEEEMNAQEEETNE